MNDSLGNRRNGSPWCSGMAVKVFFGNLAPVTTEQEMYSLFMRYGTCSELVILKDRKQRPRGAGFVTFSDINQAANAIYDLDRSITLPGAHKPLEVRFPENKEEKKRRIKSMKYSKDLVNKAQASFVAKRNHSAFGSSISYPEPQMLRFQSSEPSCCIYCGTERVIEKVCLDCAHDMFRRDGVNTPSTAPHDDISDTSTLQSFPKCRMDYFRDVLDRANTNGGMDLTLNVDSNSYHSGSNESSEQSYLDKCFDEGDNGASFGTNGFLSDWCHEMMRMVHTVLQ